MPSVTKLSTLLHAAALTASACALVAAPPTMAQGTLLYDIDFSAPTHTLNAKPAVGAAPNKISRINFGSPKVVSGFGELTDRPLLFTGGSESYDQIELNGNVDIETCRVEFDLITDSLKGTGMSFTFLFDTPTVRRFSFDGGTGKIENTSFTWEENRRLHCTAFVDFKNNRWEAHVDGNLMFSLPLNAPQLESIRFSVGSLGARHPEVRVAVDNIQVFVTNRANTGIPSNVTATGGTGASDIKLSWSEVSGASSYQIYRYIVQDPSRATLIAETSTLEYTDTEVNLGQPYYYWVRSVIGDSISPFGPFSSARINLAPPSNLTVSGLDRNDGILLAWVPPARATSYKIYRSLSNFSPSATLFAATPELTYLDRVATPGVRYYYWVESLAGPITSGTRIAGNGIRALDTVTDLQASANVFSGRIELQWTPVFGASEYRIFRGLSENFADAIVVGTSLSPKYSDLTGESDVKYYYWVSPFTAAAEGSPGASVFGVASLFQPDLWLEGDSEKEFGRGIVQGSENPRVLTEWGSNRSPFATKLWVEKIGVRDGRVKVEGSHGNKDFGVDYYREGNVTAEVLSGRLEVDSADGSGPIEIVIQPSRRIQNMPGERVYTLVCRGVSIDVTSAEDQVRMTALSLPKRLRKPVRKPARKPQVPAWTRPSIEDRAN